MGKFESYDEDLSAGDPRDQFLGRGSGRSSPNPEDIAEDVEPDVAPLILPAGTWTLLSIVERCDNAVLPAWPPVAQPLQQETSNGERLVPFFVEESDKQPIGFLRPSVLEAMLADNEAMTTKMKMAEPCWKVLRQAGKQNGNTSIGSDGIITGVAIHDWVNEEGKEARTEHMDRLVRKWREQGLFPEELKGWRDEKYHIYGPKVSQDDPRFSPLPGANTAFSIERSACSLFGFSTFGAHLVAYVKKDNKYLFWVPKRAANKQTWPGYLDNAVAGGITAGDSPLETIIRECAEEASLAPAFVRKRIQATGAISYVYRNKSGWLQPETQYLYDLEMPSLPDGDSNRLRPNDGEAEDFKLMSAEEVLDRMVKEEFKPNCAVVLIDFFLRHGLLTAETDAKYLDINQRLKRSLWPLPGPA